MQGAFDSLILEMAVIFGGASILGSLFVWLKQPIILAYIVLGILAGPYGFSLIVNNGHIEAVATLGIILLMFLLGLHLHPRSLFTQLKQTSLVTFLCISITGVLIWALLSFCFNFSSFEAAVAGLALAFSSTVLSLKLIPTTTLHHKRTGEVLISVLLFEDILAILTILLLYNDGGDSSWVQAALLPLKTIGFALVAWGVVSVVLLPLMRTFDTISEYTFLLSLGWCLAAAELAELVGLSHEIGAFIAGVSMATSPIASFIAEGLKPLREFFLILFFFSVGAQFDPALEAHLIIAIVCTAGLVLLVKPFLFKWLLHRLAGEKLTTASEMGLRLGQSSEFSLLLAYGALTVGRISQPVALLIEGAAIVTFVISTYWVVFTQPTPISPRKELRCD